eukprot:10640429-Alexandrium_andersonii.AAC.1
MLCGLYLVHHVQTHARHLKLAKQELHRPSRIPIAERESHEQVQAIRPVDGRELRLAPGGAGAVSRPHCSAAAVLPGLRVLLRGD